VGAEIGPEPVTAAPHVLRLRNLSKRFGATLALSGVDLEVAAGEVHALLGHNGSGKSTLIRVLAGYHAPEPGALLEVNGLPVPLPLRAGQFRRLGMAFVHQDPGLAPALSVVENIRIGALAQRLFSPIDWAREASHVRALLNEFDIDCDPLAPVRTLRPWQQPVLAIIRAVDELRRVIADRPAQHGLLVLDEPTARLEAASVERLIQVIRRVRDLGFGVLFVSHDLVR
jgi:ribose transport system ATP-binding protein